MAEEIEEADSVHTRTIPAVAGVENILIEGIG